MIARYAYPLPSSCCQSHHSGLFGIYWWSRQLGWKRLLWTQSGWTYPLWHWCWWRADSSWSGGVDCGLISQLWKTLFSRRKNMQSVTKLLWRRCVIYMHFILLIPRMTFHDQVCFITRKIRSSPQCHGRFYKIAQSKYGGNPVTESLVGLMVVQEIHTQWNYTQGMIDRACRLKSAFLKSTVGSSRGLRIWWKQSGYKLRISRKHSREFIWALHFWKTEGGTQADSAFFKKTVGCWSELHIS